MPRIPYVTYDDLSPQIQSFLNGNRDAWDNTLNVLKMVANSQVVYGSFVKLGAKLLLEAELNPVYREFAILRVAILTKSRYEWVQHVPIARNTGIPMEKITPLTDWKNATVYTPEERTILAFTDEVVQYSRASDKTFQAASAFLSRQSITELVLSIGYWNMVAFMMNTLGVEVEPDFKKKNGDVLPADEPDWSCKN